ncbi:hypothetical protein [Amycolatopsis magusensis]|uniref:Uncharacterized protein n=1 Tax=Amycolatopsis magusensis TaxID=882444 RepID=A0ABS4Q382_9PSEU|nr:hypothetical protein [Amycolatopsis magusensis]MBP2185544.1 hypothetical protein [Amycolatopsis magusensis]MDI5979251.1 hypothetical protein [Amycolatopsis magusensis]
MSLFKRRTASFGLPGDIVGRTVSYIRVETSSPDAPTGFDLNSQIYSMYSLAAADPARFIADLAAAVLPAGGEAARGGARLVWELVTSDYESDPNFHAMVDAGLVWLRERGVGFEGMFGYEIARWQATRGGTA